MSTETTIHKGQTFSNKTVQDALAAATGTIEVLPPDLEQPTLQVIVSVLRALGAASRAHGNRDMTYAAEESIALLMGMNRQPKQ